MAIQTHIFVGKSLLKSCLFLRLTLFTVSFSHFHESKSKEWKILVKLTKGGIPWMYLLSERMHPFSFLFPKLTWFPVNSFQMLFSESSVKSASHRQNPKYILQECFCRMEEAWPLVIPLAEGSLPGTALLFPPATINRIYNLPPKCLWCSRFVNPDYKISSL